ncbi:tRNA pseudouridine synthase B [Bifidobacterium callitrichos]|uniref:tRNA pseudouridine synthase B n=1 Tax=Bifidobacterium callitrichos DSM 23973 TaxID=1437609 RepID=A0A087A974_9BIFI|nr:tRNA pseudouridine(55) synthase TruB [Bifidobacterium callitrichos]KFI55324.1 tRNA pseudouridine synthase B [Bifidobacterium callitrichos DSM 23973]
MSDGLLIVDKPLGVTSFDAVAAVRGALHTKKVGHAGTLDPMATGMLVIGFGRATRLLQYIVEHDKTYEATIRLGMRTTTDDAEGETIIDPEASERWAALSERVVESKTESGDPAQAVAPSTTSTSVQTWRGLIERTIAERFLGDIEQVPNTFSAIKINGKRAYDLAREGKEVELKERPVHIAEFAVLDVRPGRTSSALAGSPLTAAADTDATDSTPGDADATITVIDVDVRVSCSSGTYIRALARDLGETLGVGGHLTRLRRTRVGRFALSDDHSGLGATVQAITAHAEARTFTNREGEAITRSRCVLDTPEGMSGEERTDWLLARSVPMGDAARGAMPVIEIDDVEARELRFGRRLERRLAKDVMQAAAIVPATAGTSETQTQDDVVAIVERANAHQIKPSVVFPAE